MTFRCDWLPKGTSRPETTWHDTEQAAEVAAWRLRYAGTAFVVVWRDWAVWE